MYMIMISYSIYISKNYDGFVEGNRHHYSREKNHKPIKHDKSLFLSSREIKDCCC